MMDLVEIGTTPGESLDDLDLMFRTWSGLRRQMMDMERPEAQRLIGAWAIDVLAETLGEEWLVRAAASDDGVPPDLVSSLMNQAAFGHILDLALRLRLLQGMPGMAPTRKALKKNLTDDSRRHVRLVLEVASLVEWSGQQAVLERGLRPGAPPVDVHWQQEEGAIHVEAFTVALSDLMRQGRRSSERLAEVLRDIEFGFDAIVAGRLEHDFADERDLAIWLARVREAAEVVQATGVSREISGPNAAVVYPALRAPSGARFEGPTVSGEGIERLMRKLAVKATQAEASGATWLRVEALDGLWTFTPWASWSLGQKTAAVGALIRDRFAASALHGVVLSSGPALAWGGVVEESAFADGGVRAMRRELPLFRGRETLVIPLTTEYGREASAWSDLYDNEGAWQPWALTKLGLPSLDGASGATSAD